MIAILQNRYHIDQLYALPSWLGGDFKVAIPNSHSQAEVEPVVVSEKELARISQLTTPNQVLAVVHLPDHSNDDIPDLSTHWSLYLDGIQSPANLGAILRVADWFGFQRVFGGPGTADLFNHKSIQASMGSFLRVDYRTMELQQILAVNPELPVLAADLTGESVFTFTPPPAGLLVIGSEGQGIRTNTRELVTQYLRIPSAKGRRVESLNAAVATGILCGALYEKQSL
ncbi:MAG: RNA methyltransferase [Bacteroidota bacterium]